MSTGGSAVEARISGEIRGQVAVGNNIVQYNVDHGGVVWAADPAGLPQPRRRNHVRVVGRRPELVGRESELRAVAGAVTPATPVELSGPAGVGKTALLKNVAHTLPAADVAVVYHDARGEPVDDVLQFLYDSFYETGVPFKPTPGQLRGALAGVDGLVVLDDVALDRAAMDSVLDAVPDASVVLASDQRRLWGQGRALTIHGLPPDAAVALLERELDRPLQDEDRAAAEQACDALDRHPLGVIQLAALVRDLGGAVAEASAGLDVPAAPAVLEERLASSLGSDQLRLLGILEAVLGASLSARHLAELAGVPDVAAAVEPLLRTGLVQAHSPRYSVRSESQRGARDGHDRAHDVADYLARLGEGDREPEALAEEAPAVLAVLKHAEARRDWATVGRLGRAVERALAVSRRWGAWEIVLRHQLAAAGALGDRPAEAWALHQLGTRALCLEDHATARFYLQRALALRRSLGDEEGSAATTHNLAHLDGPPPPPPQRGPEAPPDDRPRGPAPRSWLAVALAAAVVALSATVAAVLVGRGGGHPKDSRLIATSNYSIRLEPAEVDFGEAPVGSAGSRRQVTVVNTGSSPVRLGQPSTTGATTSFILVADSCALKDIPPGGRCDVEVVFRPPAAGSHRADVRLPLPDGAGTVGLRGRGVVPSATTTSSSTDGAGARPGPTVAPTEPPITFDPSGRERPTSTSPAADADVKVELTGGCSDDQYAALYLPPMCIVTATVTNQGPGTANDVVLAVGATGGMTVEGVETTCRGTTTCRLGSLAAGRGAVGRFAIGKLNPGGSVLASVRATERDRNLPNNGASFAVPAPPG